MRRRYPPAHPWRVRITRTPREAQTRRIMLIRQGMRTVRDCLHILNGVPLYNLVVDIFMYIYIILLLALLHILFLPSFLHIKVLIFKEIVFVAAGVVGVDIITMDYMCLTMFCPIIKTISGFPSQRELIPLDFNE
jgi:hypothetical protein